MIKYSGMKAEESGNGGSKQLPAGAYVAKVLGARIIGLEPDQQLEVMLDIVWPEEYKDFYMDKFTAQKQRGSNYEVKYKGIRRLRIPNPDNKKAMYPESDMRNFNDMIARFQNSNPGVELFNDNGFDESKLTDLIVGISVQDDEMNGNQYTKIARFENAEDVKAGNVTKMAPAWEKRRNPTRPAPVVDQKSGMQVVTGKLPWD
jgi:hypothetical protein